MKISLKSLIAQACCVLPLCIITAPAIAQIKDLASNEKAAATKPGDYYVASEETKERLSPARTGKVTNTLFKRQKVTVLELKDGWARVSKYYDGDAEGVRGQVARWVDAGALSTERPADEKVSGADGELRDALKDSDNFGRYSKVFMDASKKLIDEKMCTLIDFKSAGGWMKSSLNSSGNVYFVYCGGMKRSDRLYLDVQSGKAFK